MIAVDTSVVVAAFASWHEAHRAAAAALITLPGREQRALVRVAAAAGLTGGAIYDALVAGIAKHANATLLTRDRRAVPSYETIGVRYELIP